MKENVFFLRFLRSEKGAIEIIAAVSLVALMGFSAFALDMGSSYSRAAKLQNALDSAALAAVKELPASDTGSQAWNSAELQALKFAQLNGIEIAESNVSPLYGSGSSEGNIRGIKITKTVTVDYYFAKVLGINSGSVTRSASASLTPVGALSGAVPLCVTSVALKTAIDRGATSNLLIKCSPDTGVIGIDCVSQSGWFGALRFDGSGASDYSNNIAYGFRGKVQVGQILDVESGNMSGPTLTGFNTRFSQCHDGCTPENHKSDCPKIVYIPVVSVLSGKQVKVTGFTAFFLTSCGGSGGNSYITAAYLGNIVIRDASGGTSGDDFGVYSAKLTN